MGTCYSKTGHDVPPDREKRPRDKKKDSHKNGHSISHKHNQLVIDYPIQKDLSDTVYTEDSHFIQTDGENCINKSQQTSLDHLSKDANKNIENGNSFEAVEANECVVLNCKSLENAQCDLDDDIESHTEISKLLNPLDGKVSTSDSGIVVEGFKGCDISEKTYNACDDYSQDFESHVDSIAEDTSTAELDHVDGKKKTNQLVCNKSYCRLSETDSKHCDSHGHRPLTDHSNTCHCHEGEHRQSLASIDRLSESNKRTESTSDLDKIRLAIRQNSVGTPTEHRSFLDGSEISYDLPTIQQPEVTTMTMNGRDVVVIDSDLFSQIIDEIQSLKMKLSQLTEVIQDSDDIDLAERGIDVSILSSSA